MIILGIDPGTTACGYGAVKKQGNQLQVLGFGIVETGKEDQLGARLGRLKNGIEDILERFKPDEVAIEEVFFAKNRKTAISVAQARGVVVALVNCAKIKCFEYKPASIKVSVTGYGAAKKEQIQKMVKLQLKMEKIPKPDDAADALAVAIAHINSTSFNRLKGV